MSCKPSKKPTPDPSPTVVVANKSKAAIGQFEGAILLWFNEADPISILVLVSNAHDCYHALGKKIGKPSFHAEFMGTMPPSVQERAKYIQDFAKHGFKDLDEETKFDTALCEILMMVCLDRHRQIFEDFTPLMLVFAARAFSEQPPWLQLENLPQILRDSGIVEDVGKGSRKECFTKLLPVLRELRIHLARPPEIP